jgi:hypothetical protein
VTITALYTTTNGQYTASFNTEGFPKGIYTIKQDGTEVAKACVGYSTYTLNLQAGWNLISIPIIPVDYQINAMFTPLEQSKIGVIWEYNAINPGNPWSYWTTISGYDNQFTTLNPDKGYYFYCYEPITVQIIGSPGSGPIPWSSLSTGWNVIGYPSSELSNINSLYSDALVVWKLENNDEWSYWTTIPGYENQFDTLSSGLGYWVYKS